MVLPFIQTQLWIGANPLMEQHKASWITLKMQHVDLLQPQKCKTTMLKTRVIWVTVLSCNYPSHVYNLLCNTHCLNRQYIPLWCCKLTEKTFNYLKEVQGNVRMVHFVCPTPILKRKDNRHTNTALLYKQRSFLTNRLRNYIRLFLLLFPYNLLTQLSLSIYIY